MCLTEPVHCPRCCLGPRTQPGEPKDAVRPDVLLGAGGRGSSEPWEPPPSTPNTWGTNSRESELTFRLTEWRASFQGTVGLQGQAGVWDGGQVTGHPRPLRDSRIISSKLRHKPKVLIVIITRRIWAVPAGNPGPKQGLGQCTQPSN